MTIEKTLAEREARYGSFADHAELSQNLTAPMHAAPKWGQLAPIHRESLEMIQHKVARILNGDPDYADNWHDIAGYATLVENHLADRVVSEQLQTRHLPGIAAAQAAGLQALAQIGEKPFVAGEAVAKVQRETNAEDLQKWVRSHWLCYHGNHDVPGKPVRIGEACPTCFATSD